MSRSNQKELKNPSKYFLEWKGADGVLVYCDKESEENIAIDLPFTFIVLDKLATVRGYSDTDKSGYWSNEVKNTKTDKLTVRTKKGICAVGLWNDIKEKSELKGAGFCQSVYIAYQSKEGMILANLQIKGCALGEWITFCKKNNVFVGGVKITSGDKEKKGASVFYRPKFEAVEITNDLNEKSLILDKELQDYLDSYFKVKTIEASNNEQVLDFDENTKQDDTNDLPF